MSLISVGSQRSSVSLMNGSTLVSVPCSRHLSTIAGVGFRAQQPWVTLVPCSQRSSRYILSSIKELHLYLQQKIPLLCPDTYDFPISIGQLESLERKIRRGPGTREPLPGTMKSDHLEPWVLFFHGPALCRGLTCSYHPCQLSIKAIQFQQPLQVP